jgi:hypothetical protein
MSKFQTIVEVPNFKWETGYSKKNMFMGSCFTENIGSRMSDLNYDVDINPFGILYNPVSVANGIRILLEKKEFENSDLIQNNGLWHSFFHHGRFSDVDDKKVLDKINHRINYSSNHLKTTDYLFITFGTAWVYNYTRTGETVSNCHKIPDKEFERVRLSADQIAKEYTGLIDQIKNINPAIKLIFTVSPIRHWKDGAIENQRSKATLLLAVDQIIKNRKDICDYFPSYEIMMDELRDYRFYAEDMLHISDVAVNHIWEKFEAAFLSDESRNISKKIKKIKTAVNHRPFNQFTSEHLEFLKTQLSKTKLLEKNYPLVNLGKEKQTFINQIMETEKGMLNSM